MDAGGSTCPEPTGSEPAGIPVVAVPGLALSAAVPRRWRVSTLAAGAHMVPLTRPDELAAVVEDFLATEPDVEVVARTHIVSNHRSAGPCVELT
jgi:hypothetical protein